MDKSIKPNKGRTVDKPTIQNTIENFINLRKEFVSLDTIAMQLHFGLKRHGKTPFDRTENNLVYEPYITDALSMKTWSKVHPIDRSAINRMYPMVLEHKLLNTGRLALILKQNFSTKATKRNEGSKRGILFDPKQKVSKKTGYYYRWTFKGDSVTISKMIGTTNVNQLKKQGEDLVRECQRFIFCYCQG